MNEHRYIIKNCPAFAKGIFCKGGDIIDDGCADKTLGRNILLSCQDYTDCLLKQIFLETYKLVDNLDEKITIDTLGTNFQKAMEALTKIRKLLDIQEVE